MGYGDWIHWTSIIRDLCFNVNSKKSDKGKRKYIKKLMEKFKTFPSYGVRDFKMTNSVTPFKIFINNPKILKHQNEIFLNNPYITYDENYPNYIDFKFKSQDYWSGTYSQFRDSKHIVSTYCDYIGMTDYKIKAEMYFTNEELKKVQKIVPKEDFILIQPCDYKGYVKYPLNKFQEIVNKLKDKISFYQVGPEVYVKKKTILLDNAKSLLGKTSSFREGVLLMKYAKLCLVVEGGLSIGSNVVNAKTIATYNASFNPIMTNYDNVIPIHIASKDHYSCGVYTCSKKIKKKYPDGCLKCKELGENHDVNIIINKIKEELNI